MSSATDPWAPVDLGTFERPRRNTTPIRIRIREVDPDTGVKSALDDTGYSYKLEGTSVFDPDAEDTPPTPEFELTASGDGTGIPSFAVTAAQMDPSVDVVFIDVEMTDASSKTRTVAKGRINFTPVQTDYEETG